MRYLFTKISEIGCEYSNLGIVIQILYKILKSFLPLRLYALGIHRLRIRLKGTLYMRE